MIAPMSIPPLARHASSTPLTNLPPTLPAPLPHTESMRWYPGFRDITFSTIIIDLESLGEREAFSRGKNIAPHGPCPS